MITIGAAMPVIMAQATPPIPMRVPTTDPARPSHPIIATMLLAVETALLKRSNSAIGVAVLRWLLAQYAVPAMLLGGG